MCSIRIEVIVQQVVVVCSSRGAARCGGCEGGVYVASAISGCLERGETGDALSQRCGRIASREEESLRTSLWRPVHVDIVDVGRWEIDSRWGGHVEVVSSGGKDARVATRSIGHLG